MTDARPAAARRPRLVLLVEHDEDTREMYAQSLAFYGFQVVLASSGAEAIEKAHALRPDLIATDIGLPGGMDGCQLAESLKSSVHTNEIPVIAVTGWIMGPHVERALKAGCNSVLAKPCLPETLLAEIHRLLPPRKSRDD